MLFFGGSGIYYTARYWDDNRYLEEEVVERILDGTETPSGKVEKISKYVYGKLRVGSTVECVGFYYNPLFWLVKATPRQVLITGVSVVT